MIERYSRKKIKEVWQDYNRYSIWLKIELAAAEAMEKLKIIPKGVVKKVRSKAKKLIDITYQAMMKGIEILKDGIHIGDIGAKIQKHVESNGCSVVQDFCGHGIGRSFHEEPNVLHFGKEGTGDKIKAGMIFTIEPMINLGGYETKVLNDGWTAVTKDKSLSAQFEHTVGITKEGYEIFTKSKQVN